MTAAISLERKIKNRNRQWEIDLIEKNNPHWDDLSGEWMDSQLRFATRRMTEGIQAEIGGATTAQNDGGNRG